LTALLSSGGFCRLWVPQFPRGKSLNYWLNMRLLNVKTFCLEEFLYDKVPRYAILSHCWESDPSYEVSFEDFMNGDQEGKQAFPKVQQSAALAERQGLSHIWIDTCCIDKKSSAELSENINSMFTYYERAAECYVYLQDVYSMEEFARSRW
jgi:hypothetical protein